MLPNVLVYLRPYWKVNIYGCVDFCVQKIPGMKEEDEPEEEEEEELGHAETYAEYMPMKCKYRCCVGFKCQCYIAEYFLKTRL